MKTSSKVFFLLIFLSAIGFAQTDSTEGDSIEVYVIDSFIPPDNPNVFNLSFFTSVPAKSKVTFDEEYEFEVSKNFSEEHKIQIDLTKINFKSKNISYVISVEDSLGNSNKSERYEFELQEEIHMQDESNFVLLCLFAGTVFLLPNPVLVITKDENYFSLTKEIALFTFRGSYRYPRGYFTGRVFLHL